MFVYNTQDVIWGIILAIIILGYIYNGIKNKFLIFKYRKCPECGCKTKKSNDSRECILSDKTVHFTKIKCPNCKWYEEV